MVKFMGLDAGQWQAIGTIALVLVTIAYVVITARLSSHAESSAASASTAAKAAEKSARLAEESVRAAQLSVEISGQALVVASTPVLVWSSLSGKVNDAGNPELDYRLKNTGPVVALEVAVAPIRYPIDGEPRQEGFRRITSAIGPGESFPAHGFQEASMVIPASNANLANWIHAVGNDSFGFVTQYRDFAGRTWRSEMGRSAEAPLRLERIDPAGVLDIGEDV